MEGKSRIPIRISKYTVKPLHVKKNLTVYTSPEANAKVPNSASRSQSVGFETPIEMELKTLRLQKKQIEKRIKSLEKSPVFLSASNKQQQLQNVILVGNSACNKSKIPIPLNLFRKPEENNNEANIEMEKELSEKGETINKTSPRIRNKKPVGDSGPSVEDCQDQSIEAASPAVLPDSGHSGGKWKFVAGSVIAGGLITGSAVLYQEPLAAFGSSLLEYLTSAE